MTINQIIAFCLVAVLVAFIVVLANMAYHAIGLIKRSKVLVEAGNNAVEETKSKIGEISDRLIEALKAVVTDTTPVVRAVAGTGILFAGFGLIRLIVGAFLGRLGILSALASRRERKIAEKEIMESRKTIKAVNRQKKLERQAFARAEKQSRMIARKEAKLLKAEAKAALRAQKKENKAAARADKAAAVAAAKIERKAARAGRKTAKKQERKLKNALMKQSRKDGRPAENTLCSTVGKLAGVAAKLAIAECKAAYKAEKIVIKAIAGWFRNKSEKETEQLA